MLFKLNFNLLLVVAVAILAQFVFAGRTVNVQFCMRRDLFHVFGGYEYDIDNYTIYTDNSEIL